MRVRVPPPVPRLATNPSEHLKSHLRKPQLFQPQLSLPDPPYDMSKLLFDFFPLLLFFAAYKFGDIFIATGVAIAASVVQLGWLKLAGKKIEVSHIITFAVIFLFGGLTLLFRDESFIKWKPTIVNWLFAAIMFFTHFGNRKTAIEYLMGSQISLPVRIWRGMNLSWIVFFIVVGCLNVYVAFYYAPQLSAEVRTDIWVKFKVFGLMGLTLVFLIVQMFFVAKHIEEVPKDESA